MTIPLIILALLMTFFLSQIFLKESASTLGEGTVISEEDKHLIVSFVKQNYEKIAMNYDSIDFPENKMISYKDILSIICIESGPFLVNGKKNQDLIGDDGKSFGIMQVSEEALQDVNLDLGLYNVKSDLLKNVNVNVCTGAHYLELCYERAVQEKARDIRALAVRKYNAGILTATEKNLISMNYLTRFNAYRGLV